MDPTRSVGSLGAIPVDNLATLAGPAVVLAVAYWYIKVHGFMYAASLAWTVVGVIKTILTVPFNMVYWVVTSILMIPYYLLMVILSPLAWLWHAFMAPFHWFLRFLGDPYPVIVCLTIAILIGLCSGLIISLTSAIASSFIYSFTFSSIRSRKQPPTVTPTNLKITNPTNDNTTNNSREARERDRPSRTGFLNPLALHPISSPSPSGSSQQSRTRYNPYDADNELVHIEYPNLSDTNSPTLKQRNNAAGTSSYVDQQQSQSQRSPKSMSPGPAQLHARPRSAVSVKRGLGLSAIGGVGGLGVGPGGPGSGSSTLLRETIQEEEDSGFSDDSVY